MLAWVLAMGLCLSVCVHVSVTCGYWDKMAKLKMMQMAAVSHGSQGL